MQHLPQASLLYWLVTEQTHGRLQQEEVGSTQALKQAPVHLPGRLGSSCTVSVAGGKDLCELLQGRARCIPGAHLLLLGST